MNDTSSYKAQLEAEKSRLESELQSVGRRNPANPGDWEAVPEDTGREADPGDQANLKEGYAENVGILNDLEIRYADVNGALARIENGTFGTCEVGGEEIEAERLEADPAARTCIAHLNAQ